MLPCDELPTLVIDCANAVINHTSSLAEEKIAGTGVVGSAPVPSLPCMVNTQERSERLMRLFCWQHLSGRRR